MPDPQACATPDGTRACAGVAIARGIPSSAYRVLGRSGWTGSVIGFGAYRVEEGIPDHRAALEAAIRAGVNVIDTSANYTDGGSETCIGGVLAALSDSGAADRSGLIVVSKGGYVQGTNLARARARESRGTPLPEVVKVADGCWHCIHPEYLEDQITRSLERLRLERLDVFLLHNPEYFFHDAETLPGVPLHAIREEFDYRIRRAFQHLEKEVAAGRICWYGVSSNTFVRPAKDPESTSVARMWEIAAALAAERSGDPAAHRFAFVQMPVNLFEGGALLERNTGPGGGQAPLDFAREKGLGVLVNRPLNAIFGEGMLRLADFPPAVSEGEIGEHAARVEALEEEYVRAIAPHIRVSLGSTPPREFFRWAHDLREAAPKIGGAEHWREVETQVLAPQVSTLVHGITQALEGPVRGAWQEWLGRYLPEFQALVGAVRAEVTRKSAERSRLLHAHLDPFLPEPIRGESLSRKALAVLVNTPGVGCVLNGMRAPAYVEDATGVLRFAPFPVDRDLYRSFAG